MRKIVFLKLLCFSIFSMVQAQIDTIKNSTYLEIDGQTLELDLYYHSNSSPTPLIIAIHGGGWRKGSKDNLWTPGKFLDQGFAVASINYRLSQEAKFPAQIIDCKAAVRWLRFHAAQYNLNPEQFIAWGGSAGGHLAALLGTSANVTSWDEYGQYQQTSSQIQLVVDWYGPTDFLRMNDVPGKIDHDATDSPESELIGVKITDFPEKAAAANPITYIDEKTETAFLIMHGLEDDLVIPSQSILLFEALMEHDVKAELHLLAEMGHGGKGWEEQAYVVDLFFKKMLK